MGLMLSATFTFSQNVGINASGTAPENSAGLDVDFSNKGVLIPRVSLTALDVSSPISSPATSLLVYNTATAGTDANQVTPGYYYWYASKWVRLLGGEEANGKYWRVDGNSGTTPGTNFIGTTNDVGLRIKTNNSDRFEFTNNGRLRSWDNGTAGQPTYSWNGVNSNTGMYRPAASTLGFSTNGAERMRIQADGRTLVNTTSNSIPGTIPNATFRFLVRATGTENAAIAAYHTGTGPGLFVNASAPSNTFYAAEINGSTAGAGISATGGVGARLTSTNGGSIIETTNPLDYFALVVDYDAVSLGGWVTASDLRFKKNIKNLDDEESFSVLNKVLQLRPVTYNWRADEYSGLHLPQDATKIGFIAQELNEIFPELVSYKNIRDPKRIFKNGEKIEYEKYYAVNYAELTPILTQAIQEQQHIIDSQKERIERLEEQVQMLMEKIK